MVAQITGKARSDLEYEKFLTDSSQDVHVRVTDAVANSLIPSKWDYMTQSTTTTSDTYLFKSGGASGTSISTITVTYTGSDKATISTVVKT